MKSITYDRVDPRVASGRCVPNLTIERFEHDRRSDGMRFQSGSFAAVGSILTTEELSTELSTVVSCSPKR